MKNIDYAKFDQWIKEKKKDSSHHKTIPLEMMDKPMIILTGCNGSGKTQTLKSLHKELGGERFSEIKSKYKLFYYKTSTEGQVSNYVNPFNSNADSYARGLGGAFESEGERINDFFGLWMESEVFPFFFGDKDTPAKILIDEIDSGLSWDKVHVTLTGLISAIIPMESKKRDIQFIVTANNYSVIEALRSEYTKIIWVPTQEEWDPQTYEEFIEPYKYYHKKMY